MERLASDLYRGDATANVKVMTAPGPNVAGSETGRGQCCSRWIVKQYE